MVQDVSYVPRRKRKISKNRLQLLIMASLGVVFLLIFNYAPLYGITLAFTNGDYKLKIVDAVNANFVGLNNFLNFFNDDEFTKVLTNTLGLNGLMLIINFPAPIIFALLLNEIRHSKYKKLIQVLTSFPHFISWMIFGNIVLFLINKDMGIVNVLFTPIGLGDANFASSKYFWSVMIISSLIKGVGWGSIIYLTAITNIDPALYEAAEMDGANRFQKALYITLPGIAATITIYLLLSVSRILNNNFEQFYSMQNTINLDTSEMLSTFVYKKGLSLRRYSYATAVGLFDSVVSIVLLAISNAISKKFAGRGLFSD